MKEFIGRYKTFSEAVAAIGKTGKDWASLENVKDELSISNKKIEKYRSPLDVQIAAAFLMPVAKVLASGEKVLRVLDFGGGGGVHRNLIATYLEGVALDWHIIETPALVEEASRTIDPALIKFHSQIDQLPTGLKFDVILISGSLQYLENPHATLWKLVSLPHDFIIFDRLTVRVPVLDSFVDWLTIQKVGDRLELPYWHFSFPNIESNLSPTHRQVCAWEDKYDSPAGPMALDYGGATAYMGALFRKK